MNLSSSPSVQWLCQCLGVCHGAVTIFEPTGERQPSTPKGRVGRRGHAAPAPRRADHHKVCDSRAWGSGVCARARCVGKQQWFHYSTEFPHSEFLPRLPRNAIPRSVTRASALTRPCLPRCEGQRRGRAPRRPPDLTRASARWEACRDTGYPLSCRRAIVQRCRCLNTTGVAVS